jgi:RNA polymerase sigma-70 factor (ECF subfamily)
MKRPVDVHHLVSTHQVGLWRYLRLLGADPGEAEDLCQETFLAVLRRPFEEQSRAATAGYLRTVARHLLLKVRRRQRLAPREEDLDRAEELWCRDAAADGGDAWVAALRSCLEQMTSRVRRAFELQYRERRSRAELAAALGLGEEGVKSLLQRSRQRLRECIERRIHR